MNLNLKKNDFEFMKILGDQKLILSQSSKKLVITQWMVQRIYNNLNECGMLKSKKKGRKRLVKLNKNGHYFNAWYQRNKMRIGKDDNSR